MSAAEILDPGFHKQQTALLFIDPYNDFLAEGGKLWPMVEQVARSVSLHQHLTAITSAVRQQGMPLFIVPHHRAQQGDFLHWKNASPYQLGASAMQIFAKDSWGGEWHPDFKPQPGDVVIQEHWGSSGFANTDLDLQLKQRGIRQVILIGLIANTCIEATARFAAEAGYHVTLVTDATAAMSAEAMHAAHQINGPSFAHLIVNTAQLLALFPKS